MTYAVTFQTPYGPFLVNRHDRHQPEALLRTGRPHIDAEIQTLLQLTHYMRPDSIVVDAGANIGLISVPLANQLSSGGGTVHAFEPQRFNYYMLAGNAAMSGLVNLQCHRLALGDDAGMIQVPCLNPYDTQDFGMVSLTDSWSGHEQDAVAVITLDSMALPHLDLLKIDVEKMELVVLKGAQQSITNLRPLIWIEIWPAQYESVVPWLKACDYSLFVFDALNFLAVPAEKIAAIPINMPSFDGHTNPFHS